MVIVQASTPTVYFLEYLLSIDDCLANRLLIDHIVLMLPLTATAALLLRYYNQ